MRDFTSFADFGRHLQRVARAIPRHTEKALRDIGKHVEADAKGRIGIYQGDVMSPGGEWFPAWKALADTTVWDRIGQGFSPDEPLLRTGELRDSISFRLSGTWRANSVTVGSSSMIALWQEYGTLSARGNIPPRPFIQPAMAVSVTWSLKRSKAAIDDSFRKTP